MNGLKRLVNAHYQFADALVELMEAQADVSDQEEAQELVSSVLDTAVYLAVDEGREDHEEVYKALQRLLQTLQAPQLKDAA